MELWLNFMHLYIFIKFDEDVMETPWAIEQKPQWSPILKKLKGHNSKLSGGIKLVFKLSLHFVILNIYRKIDEDQTKTIWIRERKSWQAPLLINSKGHISNVLGGI